jgi:hypothetical protein
LRNRSTFVSRSHPNQSEMPGRERVGQWKFTKRFDFAFPLIPILSFEEISCRYSAYPGSWPSAPPEKDRKQAHCRAYLLKQISSSSYLQPSQSLFPAAAEGSAYFACISLTTELVLHPHQEQVRTWREMGAQAWQGNRSKQSDLANH